MLVFFAKSFRLALSMSAHVLVLSYSRITNLSTTCMTSSTMSRGAHDNVNIASVSSGSAFQMVHAVFLPWLMTNKARHSITTGEGVKHRKCLGPFLCRAQWIFCGLPSIANVYQFQMLARVHTLGPGFLQQTQPTQQHLCLLS